MTTEVDWREASTHSTSLFQHSSHLHARTHTKLKSLFSIRLEQRHNLGRKPPCDTVHSHCIIYHTPCIHHVHLAHQLLDLAPHTTIWCMVPSFGSTDEEGRIQYSKPHHTTQRHTPISNLTVATSLKATLPANTICSISVTCVRYVALKKRCEAHATRIAQSQLELHETWYGDQIGGWGHLVQGTFRGPNNPRKLLS